MLQKRLIKVIKNANKNAQKFKAIKYEKCLIKIVSNNILKGFYFLFYVIYRL